MPTTIPFYQFTTVNGSNSTFVHLLHFLAVLSGVTFTKAFAIIRIPVKLSRNGFSLTAFLSSVTGIASEINFFFLECFYLCEWIYFIEVCCFFSTTFFLTALISSSAEAGFAFSLAIK
jgi:hypothetical protein